MITINPTKAEELRSMEAPTSGPVETDAGTSDEIVGYTSCWACNGTGCSRCMDIEE